MPKKVSVSAVDYSDIYGVQLRHAYEQMKVAADELYERDIKTFDGSGMERKRWVDRAKYLDGEGRVELSFTIHVMPYLTMLYSKVRSEEHTSELQSLMRISYAVFCLQKKTK